MAQGAWLMMHETEQTGNQMAARQGLPLGTAKVEAVLSDLAVNGQVSASTIGRGMAACTYPRPLQNWGNWQWARGGIGRREGLRILWSNPCRFDPCRAHA